MKLNHQLWHLRNNDEKVPKDVTHVIVDDNVSVIKSHAFHACRYLISIIMGDNVKRIEMRAFFRCTALRFVRLSRTLEYIGYQAFWNCESLEALFLPSTVKSIGDQAFQDCRSMRFIMLPHEIDLRNVGKEIIRFAAITDTETANLAWEYDNGYVGYFVSAAERSRRMNRWLYYHMDAALFHKVCYGSYVTTKQISDYLTEHGNDAALAIDTIHGMTPLHILSMNPHAPADTILTLLKANVNAANGEDNKGKTPFYYALHYNPCAFVRMYSFFNEHTIEIDIQSWEVDPPVESEYDDTDDDTDGDDDTDDDVNDLGCTPLHVLARNPFVPANVIAALLELKMEDAFCPDNEGLSPLDYAEERNVEGLVSMISVLCNHRNSMSKMVENKVMEHSKKRKIQP